jgi:hypothetical protein
MAVALLCLAAAASAQASFPGRNGKIAFFATAPAPFHLGVMNPDGSGQTAIPNTEGASRPNWSPDGKLIAYEDQGDSGPTVFVVGVDGSSPTPLSDLGGSVYSPAWSPAGNEIATEQHYPNACPFPEPEECPPDTVVLTVRAYPSGATAATPGGSGVDSDWSPDGSRIVFADGGIRIVARAGGPITLVTSGTAPSWAPDGSKIAFEDGGDIWMVNPDGTGRVQLTFDPSIDGTPEWSPDGTKIAFTSNRDGDADIYVIDADGTDVTQLTHNTTSDSRPAWQPIPFTGYARPKGAGPLRVSLVPAYRACTEPDHVHGPPLAFPSCTAPAPESPNLTVGTTEVNGAQPNFAGSVRYGVIAGNPGLPHDSDILVGASLTDVRCATGTAGAPPCGDANADGGPDYAGELEARVSLRLTDRFNAVAAGGGRDAATVTDTEFVAPIGPCATTPSEAGATCTLLTAANAIVPGIAQDGRRAIWQLDRVRVYDGGPDGDVDTAGNSVFATQGVFVP